MCDDMRSRVPNGFLNEHLLITHDGYSTFTIVEFATSTPPIELLHLIYSRMIGWKE